MNVWQILLYLAALVFFVLAAVGVPSGRFSLVAAGLTCVTAGFALVPMVD